MLKNVIFILFLPKSSKTERLFPFFYIFAKKSNLIFNMKKIGVFCASSNNLDETYYKEAEKLGRWMGETGKVLVYGGANCGMMQAIAKGTKEAGGSTIGVVPQILFDKGRVSPYIDTLIRTNDLTDRKAELIDNSDVILALPGSVGTLDEVFCVMSSHQIGIHDKIVVFWNINGFWNSLFALFEDLVTKGVVNTPFETLCIKADTFEELKQILDTPKD